MTFGQKLRMMRARVGMSQADLAVSTGIERRCIGFLEADRMIPSDEWVVRIKAALGWPEDSERAFAILEGEPEKEPA